MFRGIRRLIGVGLISVVLAACQVDTSVIVTVEPDGSGFVDVVSIVTGEGVERVYDFDRNFSDSIADLQTAGWEIFPTEEIDDGQRLRLRAPFNNSDDFAIRMGQLNGDAGLFQSFTLERTQSFGRVAYELSGVVDATNGIDSFSDPSLDESLGKTLSLLAAERGVDQSAVDLNLVVQMPGALESDSDLPSVQNGDDSRIRYEIDLSSQQTGLVDVSSTEVSLAAQILRGIAVLAAVGAGLLILTAILREIAKRSAPKKKRRKKSAPKSEPDVEADGYHVLSETPSELTPEFDYMAFDGMGVIYTEPNNIDVLLIPFVREHGSDLLDDEIRAKYVDLTSGRISTEQFWSSVGAEGNSSELNELYLSTLSLTPGVVRYILGLRAEGIKIACLTNDSLEWATTSKKKHSLAELVDVWVVSGEIGLRKPSIGAFEALRRRCGVDRERILLIDDELDVLDLAHDYGFSTAWYSDESLPSGSPHSLQRSFPVPSEN